MKIERIQGMEVLDSRGNPTVECKITLKGGAFASAITPSGASTGSHEAIELRDGGKRYNGKGVLKAVKNINEIIAKKITGMDATDQAGIDRAMVAADGTSAKSRLGANAILAVSLAAARAGAISKNMELFEYLEELNRIGMNRAGKPSGIPKTGSLNLPVPFSNIINGGVHAGNDLKIQEFMVAPIKARSFSEGARMVCEIYATLKSGLKGKFGKNSTNVGDEGGFAPPLRKTEEALDLILNAIDELGYSKEVKIAIDAASSEFFETAVGAKERKYSIDGKYLNAMEMVDFYMALIGKYGLISIEDPFAEDEWGAFAEFTSKAGNKIQIVADDLTVTNTDRLQKAVSLKCANCLLLKVNQIGTLTESMEASSFSFANGWNVMVSHRSGETEDAFISDLAVALQCRQIKLGAPARGERTAKYNRLSRIEQMLGAKAKYGWVK